MKKQINLAAILLCTIILGGCTSSNPYGTAYGSADTRIIQQVKYGRIENITPVTIDTSEQSNAIGSIAGAVAGGILGSTIGGGTGTKLATLGGGLLGGYAGSQTARALGKQNGVNLTIKFDSGEIVSIVQGVDPTMMFEVGQAVQVNTIGSTVRVTIRN